MVRPSRPPFLKCPSHPAHRYETTPNAGRRVFGDGGGGGLLDAVSHGSFRPPGRGLPYLGGGLVASTILQVVLPGPAPRYAGTPVRGCLRSAASCSRPPEGLVAARDGEPGGHPAVTLGPDRGVYRRHPLVGLFV